MHASASPDPAFADPHASTHGAETPEIPRTDTGLRIVYSALFAVILHVAAGVLTLVVLIQLALALVTRHAPHPRLARFGAGLTRYCVQVTRYLTFNEKQAPFPFADLPEDLAL